MALTVNVTQFSHVRRGYQIRDCPDPDQMDMYVGDRLDC